MTETLPRRNPEIPELQALRRWNARMSTMRAPVPKEAWLAVERGPYLLGFPQWAGDGQNRRHTSNAPARHVKKASFAGTLWSQPKSTRTTAHGSPAGGCRLKMRRREPSGLDPESPAELGTARAGRCYGSAVSCSPDPAEF